MAPGGPPPVIVVHTSSAIETYTSSRSLISCPVLICMITAVLKLEEIVLSRSFVVGRQVLCEAR